MAAALFPGVAEGHRVPETEHGGGVPDVPHITPGHFCAEISLSPLYPGYLTMTRTGRDLPVDSDYRRTEFNKQSATKSGIIALPLMLDQRQSLADFLRCFWLPT